MSGRLIRSATQSSGRRQRQVGDLATMERKPAVAVVFHHIPYHHARLNAAADRLSVTGIGWSAEDMTPISLDDKGPGAFTPRC